MTQFVHIAIISDRHGKEVMRQEFDKHWKAVKWASKKIDEHKKLNEWFYETMTDIRGKEWE